MKISVVIATHNRADMLPHAIESVLAQTLERDDFEIIVVDSGSTDHTGTVVEQFATATVRYLREERPGLSRARNSGWQHARGRYVAFLDDDATATPQWLESLLHGFSTLPAGTHACVGGKVVLALPAARPGWLHDSLTFCLGALDIGSKPTDITNSTFFLHGCNMAFTKEALEHFGGFASSLGRIGARLTSGEEVLLQRRIRAAGGHCLFIPDASVVHHVAPERLSRRWFLRRMYAEGVSTARIDRYEQGPISFSDEIRALWYEFATPTFLTRPDFARYCSFLRRLGRIRESLRRSRNAQ